MACQHQCEPHELPFVEPENLGVFTTTRVLDEDGDWQVLCGTTASKPYVKIVCFGCLFDRDRSLAAIAKLPLGWRARRESPEAEWETEPK